MSLADIFFAAVAPIGAASGALGGYLAAKRKARATERSAELDHDARIAPGLLDRIDRLETDVGDCEKGRDELQRQVSYLAGKMKREMQRRPVTRASLDDTGMHELEAIERQSIRPPPPPRKPTMVPPPPRKK